VDAAQWDARYSASELVWGTEPNVFVAAELGGLAPGVLLDVACGEGRNSIWLAHRGWQAVGVDFSAEAIRRARRMAEQTGVAARVRFVVGDVVADPLPPGPFDAVVLAYLQLPAPQRRAALRKAAARLRPAGALLVVGHDAANLTDGFGGPQDPAVLFTARDVVGDLADLPGLVVERAERVSRPVLTPEGERSAVDALVRVRAEGSPDD
jgi:SAM-dependent methyltransferase